MGLIALRNPLCFSSTSGPRWMSCGTERFWSASATTWRWPKLRTTIGGLTSPGPACQQPTRCVGFILEFPQNNSHHMDTQCPYLPQTSCYSPALAPTQPSHWPLNALMLFCLPTIPCRLPSARSWTSLRVLRWKCTPPASTSRGQCSVSEELVWECTLALFWEAVIYF